MCNTIILYLSCICIQSATYHKCLIRFARLDLFDSFRSRVHLWAQVISLILVPTSLWQVASCIDALPQSFATSAPHTSALQACSVHLAFILELLALVGCFHCFAVRDITYRHLYVSCDHALFNKSPTFQFSIRSSLWSMLACVYHSYLQSTDVLWGNTATTNTLHWVKTVIGKTDSVQDEPITEDPG